MSATVTNQDSQRIERQRALVQLLENDRSLLLITQPFTAALALRLKLVAVDDKSIPTAATDGRAIFFNVDFAERIDDKTRRFVLCHEVWHCVMGHLRRRLNREPMRWNIAIDYEVNAICYQLLGDCPDNCLILPNRYHGLSAETIYDKVQVGKRSVAKLLDTHLEMSDETAMDWQEFTQQTLANSSMIGKLPGQLARRLQEIVTPRLPWQYLLQRYIQRQLRGEREWFPPSRRHIHRGLYLPRQRSEHVDITVAIDTSGSCRDELGKFLGQLRYLLGTFKSYQVTLLQCDTRIREVRTLTPELPLEINDFQFKGFGGTDFTEVFNYVQENPTSALVFFTDGHVDLPADEPAQPMLWVLTSNGVREMPWGDVAKMS